MTIDELNRRVSAAIYSAEQLERRGQARETASQYAGVSVLEEEIARLLGPETNQGAIARRGAVRAALRARDPARALDLADGYLAASSVPDRLAAELSELRDEARRVLDEARASGPRQVYPHRFGAVVPRGAQHVG